MIRGGAFPFKGSAFWRLALRLGASIVDHLMSAYSLLALGLGEFMLRPTFLFQTLTMRAKNCRKRFPLRM